MAREAVEQLSVDKCGKQYMDLYAELVGAT